MDDLQEAAEEFDCWHIAVVSISETECQCMDCLRTWPKEEGFRSDAAVPTTIGDAGY